MSENPNGIYISGSSVSGGVSQVSGKNNRIVQGENNQSVQGDNNQVIQQSTEETSEEKPLTQADVLQLLAELEHLVKESQLPAETKEEVGDYLKATQRATEKEEPKKTTAIANLESAAETLDALSKTLDAGSTLWTKAKPIVIKIVGWLGAAVAGSFLGGL
ncbi:MAG: hypothetical protein AAGA60_30480 [Cyanobacteria bacterium P01_E01_bin.42]